MYLPFFRRLDEYKPKYVLCRIFSCCVLFLLFSSADKGFSDGKFLQSYLCAMLIDMFTCTLDQNKVIVLYNKIS